MRYEGSPLLSSMYATRHDSTSMNFFFFENASIDSSSGFDANTSRSVMKRPAWLAAKAHSNPEATTIPMIHTQCACASFLFPIVERAASDPCCFLQASTTRDQAGLACTDQRAKPRHTPTFKQNGCGYTPYRSSTFIQSLTRQSHRRVLSPRNLRESSEKQAFRES